MRPTRAALDRMQQPSMPTTIPSPVARGEFDFIAKDRDGIEWRWDDRELVWKRIPERPARDRPSQA